MSWRERERKTTRGPGGGGSKGPMRGMKHEAMRATESQWKYSNARPCANAASEHHPNTPIQFSTT